MDKPGGCCLSWGPGVACGKVINFVFRLFSGLCVQDTNVRVFLRVAEADGHDLVVLYDDVHHAAFAYADIDRAFRRDGRDGVQDFQRCTAERAVDRGGCDHVSQLLQGVKAQLFCACDIII